MIPIKNSLSIHLQNLHELLLFGKKLVQVACENLFYLNSLSSSWVPNLSEEYYHKPSCNSWWNLEDELDPLPSFNEQRTWI